MKTSRTQNDWTPGVVLLAAAVITVVLSVPAYTGVACEPEQSMQNAIIPVAAYHTSDLMGHKVLDKTGHRIGTLYDLVLTPDMSGVSYAVLSRGGFLGIGARFYAVPWSNVSISTDGKTVTMPAPDSGLAKWSRLSGSPEPAVAGAADEPSSELRRVREIVRLDAGNMEGRYLGDLNNLVIDNSGAVTFGIVRLRGGPGMLGKPARLAAVPWDDITLQAEPRVAGIDVSEATLSSVAFEKTNWPDLSSAGYAQDVHEMLGVESGGQIYGYTASEKRPASGETSGYRGTFPSPWPRTTNPDVYIPPTCGDCQ